MTETCIHVANVVYLASFLVRDILWLRSLTCLGLVFGLLFFTCRTEPLYGPAVWHVAFLVINVVQIRRLVLERRALILTENERVVRAVAFDHLSRDEMLNLLTHAAWVAPPKDPDPEPRRFSVRWWKQKLTQARGRSEDPSPAPQPASCES